MNMNKYEIGMSFPGIPTEEQEISVLQAVLDKYGDDDAAKPLNPKRSVILNRASQCTDDWVKFDERPDESRAFVNATITMRDYLDMGEPGVITVTIEPGDLLSTQCADMTGTHFDGCDCGGES